VEALGSAGPGRLDRGAAYRKGVKKNTVEQKGKKVYPASGDQKKCGRGAAVHELKRKKYLEEHPGLGADAAVLE